ncbi:hypothetical protein PROFUN_10016 [Planoprotostelium fungivorum]|uniref:Uncharacterized protein n=1 Tax=Planoprotostelium fungivorum TaxID=1890364 RepID=A0A2P6NFU8_9EUKA|nr:hypothetical protein PROFUN_10016 [Planoprotostelium fungivorum]
MNWKTRRNLREISATKKHIQCTFIERELLGFLWFEIILYKQRLIELFGSYVGGKQRAQCYFNNLGNSHNNPKA